MESEFLRLSIWDQFTPREAEAVAQALARALRLPWQFEQIEEHACGDQRRQVAFFHWRDGTRFALIPGGPVTLGHDPNRPLGSMLQDRLEWIATCELPEEPEEFACDEEEDEFYADPQRREFFNWSDFFEWLGQLPGPRQVTLTPFLIEAESNSCDQYSSGTFDELCQTITEQGLRLPTSDEWEHACAAGSRTVWRWGDFCPDYCHEDVGDDLIHYQPNAFGLRYRGSLTEVVGEVGVYRNTDGGVALCGGHGFPCGWLSLASANVRDYFAMGWEKPGEMLPGLSWKQVRRAFTIPSELLD